MKLIWAGSALYRSPYDIFSCIASHWVHGPMPLCSMPLKSNWVATAIYSDSLTRFYTWDCIGSLQFLSRHQGLCHVQPGPLSPWVWCATLPWWLCTLLSGPWEIGAPLYFFCTMPLLQDWETCQANVPLHVFYMGHGNLVTELSAAKLVLIHQSSSRSSIFSYISAALLVSLGSSVYQQPKLLTGWSDTEGMTSSQRLKLKILLNVPFLSTRPLDFFALNVICLHSSVHQGLAG